jgi:pentatricopeptide repeat protein
MALKVFDNIKSDGLFPTVYSFTSIINACVRCGELVQAKRYFEDMIVQGIKPNEVRNIPNYFLIFSLVTYTALMKGFCQEGDMLEADKLLLDMSKNNILPNLRTFNTILRGCLRCGDITMTNRM